MSRSFGVRSFTTSIVDAELSVRDLLETRNHPQSRRLAAARRADHHHQLAVRDRQVEIEDGLRAVVEDLRDLVEFDRRQRSPLVSSRAYSVRTRYVTPCGLGRRTDELTDDVAPGSMPVELGDLDPECQPSHANPICASSQIPVGASCIPRRRRDVPAVVLAEVDLTPDSLPRQFEPHDGDLPRPFHRRVDPRSPRRLTTTRPTGPRALSGPSFPNLVDPTKQVSLDGDPPRPRRTARSHIRKPAREPPARPQPGEDSSARA